jgi:hypothetical protein
MKNKTILKQQIEQSNKKRNANVVLEKWRCIDIN